MKKPYISLIHKVFYSFLLLLSKKPGAENGTRTRDLNLGKVALYQLSYFRKIYLPRPGKTSFPAFRDCKYKMKNLFCKIFRRILSQNDIPGLRKSRGHRMGNPYFRAAE